MAPKPKEAYVVLTGEQPRAVFRDGPAAQEYADWVRESEPDTVFRVVPVRLYEYRVGKGTESE